MLNKNNAKFAVFHDIPKASDIKIHHSKCSFYQRHDPTAPTTNWYYFDNLKDAVRKGKELALQHEMNCRSCAYCKLNF